LCLADEKEKERRGNKISESLGPFPFGVSKHTKHNTIQRRRQITFNCYAFMMVYLTAEVQGKSSLLEIYPFLIFCPSFLSNDSELICKINLTLNKRRKMNFELRRANVLQRLTPNKVGPASDLRRDAFDAWELLAHAAGEELSSLYQIISIISITPKSTLEHTLGSLKRGIPKSTASS